MTLVYNSQQLQFFIRYRDILSRHGEIIVDSIFNGVRRSGRTEAIAYLLNQILLASEHKATIFTYSGDILKIFLERFPKVIMRFEDKDNMLSILFPNGSTLNVPCLLKDEQPVLKETNDIIVFDDVKCPICENDLINTVILIV